MTGKEYMEVQVKLLYIGKGLLELNLDEFTQAVDKAQVSGETVSPSLYNRAYDTLSAVQKYTRALHEAQYAFRELEESILKTAKLEQARRVKDGHDSECLLDPATMAWKRPVKKGELVPVCAPCAEMMKAKGIIVQEAPAVNQ